MVPLSTSFVATCSGVDDYDEGDDDCYEPMLIDVEEEGCKTTTAPVDAQVIMIEDRGTTTTGPHERRRRRSVGFKIDHDEVYEFVKVDTDIHYELWYTAEEYRSIKARNAELVKRMKQGIFVNDDVDSSDDNDNVVDVVDEENETVRGLEHKVNKDKSGGRRATKYSAWNAVLEEQFRQYDQGIWDDELIAAHYKQISTAAQEAAFYIALRDSEIIQQQQVQQQVKHEQCRSSISIMAGVA